MSTDAHSTFLTIAARLASRLPKGHGDLADQLRRARRSIPLNVAEGSGRFARDAQRFCSIARGSTLERAAILDAIEALALLPRGDLVEGRMLLDRMVAMLTVMLQSR